MCTYEELSIEILSLSSVDIITASEPDGSFDGVDDTIPDDGDDW